MIRLTAKSFQKALCFGAIFSAALAASSPAWASDQVKVTDLSPDLNYTGEVAVDPVDHDSFLAELSLKLETQQLYFVNFQHQTGPKALTLSQMDAIFTSDDLERAVFVKLGVTIDSKKAMGKLLRAEDGSYVYHDVTKNGVPYATFFTGFSKEDALNIVGCVQTAAAMPTRSRSMIAQIMNMIIPPAFADDNSCATPNSPAGGWFSSLFQSFTNVKSHVNTYLGDHPYQDTGLGCVISAIGGAVGGLIAGAVGVNAAIVAGVGIGAVELAMHFKGAVSKVEKAAQVTYQFAKALITQWHKEYPAFKKQLLAKIKTTANNAVKWKNVKTEVGALCAFLASIPTFGLGQALTAGLRSKMGAAVSKLFAKYLPTAAELLAKNPKLNSLIFGKGVDKTPEAGTGSQPAGSDATPAGKAKSGASADTAPPTEAMSAGSAENAAQAAPTDVNAGAIQPTDGTSNAQFGDDASNAQPTDGSSNAQFGGGAAKVTAQVAKQETTALAAQPSTFVQDKQLTAMIPQSQRTQTVQALATVEHSDSNQAVPLESQQTLLDDMRKMGPKKWNQFKTNAEKDAARDLASTKASGKAADSAISPVERLQSQERVVERAQQLGVETKPEYQMPQGEEFSMTPQEKDQVNLEIAGAEEAGVTKPKITQALKTAEDRCMGEAP